MEMEIQPSDLAEVRVDDFETVSSNFCRIAHCGNFGVVPREFDKLKRGRGIYKWGEVNGIDVRVYCRLCFAGFPLVNNRAIASEARRIWEKFRDFRDIEAPGCTNEGCKNHRRPVFEGKEYYHRFGTTRVGVQRYRCRACGGTFTAVPLDPDHFHKKTRLTSNLFYDFTHLASIKSRLHKYGTGAGTVYAKLDYLYRQCLAFGAHHEAKIAARAKEASWNLTVSTDCQTITTNWKREDEDNKAKRNHVVATIVTADNDSGFVFALHADYDPEAKKTKILPMIEQEEEAGTMRCRRETAAYRTTKDFMQLLPEERPRVPADGMMIHKTYFMHSHFLCLRKLFGDGVGKLDVCMDNDEGIGLAMTAAFRKEIRKGKVDGLLLRKFKRPKKKGTKEYEDYEQALMRAVKDKARLKQLRQQDLSELQEEGPSEDDPQKIRLPASPWELATRLVVERLRELDQFEDRSSSWENRFIRHPQPLPTEPNLHVAYITQRKKADLDEAAKRIMRASVRGSDRFFAASRMAVMPFRRPTRSASAENQGHVDFGVYDPAQVEKYAEIFRVYYNYVDRLNPLPPMPKRYPGEPKRRPRESVPKDQWRTRAMMLGLCDKPCTFQEIIEFEPPHRYHDGRNPSVYLDPPPEYEARPTAKAAPKLALPTERRRRLRKKILSPRSKDSAG